MDMPLLCAGSHRLGNHLFDLVAGHSYVPSMTQGFGGSDGFLSVTKSWFYRWRARGSLVEGHERRGSSNASLRDFRTKLLVLQAALPDTMFRDSENLGMLANET